ncbi:MAG: hypothetical protein HQK79_19090 [Desulfobacterales bacterium]|nr:hypothetical protein [Desulfobacterales bacterium]MBF0397028.1 hypothetical protein [Desulfobacterales bacterium]
MKIKFGILILAIFSLIFGQNVFAGEVVQGKCIQYNTDGGKKIVKLEEYDTNFSKEARYGKSTGIVSEWDISNAKIGMKIEAGDILRMAFKVDGNNKNVIKVMNVSKQDLRKK